MSTFYDWSVTVYHNTPPFEDHLEDAWNAAIELAAKIAEQAEFLDSVIDTQLETANLIRKAKS